ncbi:trypsin-like peptidase domain-containing protein [Nonomuraea sp. NPDC001684]
MPTTVERVAEVWSRQADASWSSGSGYLIAPRLLITSTHVLSATGRPGLGAEIKVRTADRTRLWSAVCTWSSADPQVDVAVLEIIDGDWGDPPVAPVRWGRLVSRRAEVVCQASGFPEVLAQPDGVRERDQAGGRVNPEAGVKQRRYHLQVLNSPKRSGAGSPWAGMSGAALFADDLLIGVVVADHQGYGGARLLATRAEALFAEPGFLDAIAVPAVLEPAELARLFSAPADRRRPRSPAALLRADAEAVRWFTPRDDELARLVGWCSTDEVFDARLVFGAGGLGKTRLARQLVAHLRREGWVTGQVVAESAAVLPEEPLSRLRACDLPLLLVVDYAETRPDVVRRLIENVGVDDGSAVRVLMLARSAGQWWQRLTAKSDLMEYALELAELHPLTGLPTWTGARETAFREAVVDIAAQLHRVSGLQETCWTDLAAQVALPDLGGPGYGSLMRLHLSALVGLLQAGPAPAAARSRTPHEKVLMVHENRYWRRTADAVGLAFLSDETLRNTVTIATLFGASSRSQAVALLSHVLGLRDLGENELLVVHQWLSTLYPSQEGEWGPLEPDRLGEYLVGTHLREWPDLIDEPLAAASLTQLHQAFHVLARASGDHPHVGRLLKEQVVGQLARYGPVALQVVIETEQPGYLISALEDGVAGVCASDEAALVALAGSFPAGAPALNLLVEPLTRLAISVYGRLVSEGRTDYRPELARAWQNLSDHMREAQRHDEALAARAVALELYRALTGRGGAAAGGASHAS